MDRIYRDKAQCDTMKNINTDNIATNYQSIPWPIPHHLHHIDDVLDLSEGIDQKADLSLVILI